MPARPDQTQGHDRQATALSCGLPKSCRVLRRVDYVAAQTQGQKIRGTYLLALVNPSKGKISRLGITVSKRVGKAVVRNRVKRWVREYVRQVPASNWLPDCCDVVIVAKASAGNKASYADIASDLAKIGARL